MARPDNVTFKGIPGVPVALPAASPRGEVFCSSVKLLNYGSNIAVQQYVCVCIWMNAALI
jgi:hypothetical protein